MWKLLQAFLGGSGHCFQEKSETCANWFEASWTALFGAISSEFWAGLVVRGSYCVSNSKSKCLVECMFSNWHAEAIYKNLFLYVTVISSKSSIKVDSLTSSQPPRLASLDSQRTSIVPYSPLLYYYDINILIDIINTYNELLQRYTIMKNYSSLHSNGLSYFNKRTNINSFYRYKNTNIHR